MDANYVCSNIPVAQTVELVANNAMDMGLIKGMVTDKI